MIRLHLAANSWARTRTTHARGYAHLGERSLRADEIAVVLDACDNNKAWLDTVRQLNGCFAAVTQRDSHLLAAVDRIRTLPLFYSVHGPDCSLSDDAYWVLDSSGSRDVNEIGDAEFCLTGYVTGDETLYSAVHQIRAGHILLVDAENGTKAKQLRYYEFRHANFLTADTDQLIDELEAVHSRVFRRLLASADGRPIVVPLSGGYDSRLIAVWLRDLGAKDVVCYSYGVPGNWESRISQELANYLGFGWEFVPYSAERWRAWAGTEEFKVYFRSAGNLTSVPHIQDWPAIHELRREGRITMDSVLVPGHSGDFLAGSHVPKWYVKRKTITRREFLESIEHGHYSLWDWPSAKKGALREAFDRRIESVVGPVPPASPEQAADLFERWDLEERQAKFICNSLRGYEAFGHDWRLPLFDAELMDFWARIPVELRTDRGLYRELVRKRQSLPITEANRDHGAVTNLLIGSIERAGMRAAAKRIQRHLRRLRRESAYSGSPLAWFALVDRDFFRRTYTGKELLHSYMALTYRDLAVRRPDASSNAQIGSVRARHGKDQAVA